MPLWSTHHLRSPNANSKTAFLSHSSDRLTSSALVSPLTFVPIFPLSPRAFSHCLLVYLPNPFSSTFPILPRLPSQSFLVLFSDNRHAASRPTTSATHASPRGSSPLTNITPSLLSKEIKRPRYRPHSPRPNHRFAERRNRLKAGQTRPPRAVRPRPRRPLATHRRLPPCPHWSVFGPARNHSDCSRVSCLLGLARFGGWCRLSGLACRRRGRCVCTLGLGRFKDGWIGRAGGSRARHR